MQVGDGKLMVFGTKTQKLVANLSGFRRSFPEPSLVLRHQQP
jgi:hypothetical protein